MTIIYSDELGYVEMHITDEGVQFLNGIAYCTDTHGNDYRISVDSLVQIF